MARNTHDVPGNLRPILFTYQASGYHKMMVIAREHGCVRTETTEVNKIVIDSLAPHSSLC